jgi:hypothetical protein
MEMGFRQFLEGKLGSFIYAVPKDKEKQLYDFYMLSTLGNTGDKDIDDAVRHTRERLFPTLKKELLKAVFFALMSELRHKGLTYAQQYHNEEIENELKTSLGPYADIFLKYIDNIRDFRGGRRTVSSERHPEYPGEESERLKSYEAAKDAGPRWKMVKAALAAFNKLPWVPGFGGPAWGEVARGWLKLSSAESLEDMQVWIDHVYDLQHNNGTVFNKLKEYYKRGSHEWLSNALDFKARIKSPWEIRDGVSDSMKRLSQYALKGHAPAYSKTQGHGTEEDWMTRGSREYRKYKAHIRMTRQEVDKWIDDLAREGAAARNRYLLKFYKENDIYPDLAVQIVEDMVRQRDVSKYNKMARMFQVGDDERDAFYRLVTKDAKEFLEKHKDTLYPRAVELQRRWPWAGDAYTTIISDIENLGVGYLYAVQAYRELAAKLGTPIPPELMDEISPRVKVQQVDPEKEKWAGDPKPPSAKAQKRFEDWMAQRQWRAANK